MATITEKKQKDRCMIDLSFFYIRLWKEPVASGVWAIVFLCINFLFKSEIVFVVLSAAIVLDTVTGITASLKRGEPIASWRLSRSLFEKFLAYGAILLVMASIDGLARMFQYPFETGLHIITIGWIFAIEAVSILENCQTILGIKIPFLNKIKQTRKLLTEKLSDDNKENES